MSTQKDMDHLLTTFAEQTVPGCGCILMRDGQVLYEKYAGFADLAKKKPVGPVNLAGSRTGFRFRTDLFWSRDPLAVWIRP